MANGSSVNFAVAKAILLVFVSPYWRLPEKKFQRKENGSLGEDDKMDTLNSQAEIFCCHVDITRAPLTF